ncbi:MBL fold metallo-hydrolase [Paenibacillus sp. SYP-B3998]|uniref:MBL fold metallo-hydrolase n=1 Tax=Paenibacillus sp. SYP-B3998 TaxID=2678564 RepID=A0A6G3ZYR7_9BACL|nr:MBL fold metallo-hydrolase [Paenibacillus sp. SYP-B3998]NEW06721.1 MBL fold metallo-hydrolase [Paenibacillus sp. SYP-B3998]
MKTYNIEQLKVTSEKSVNYCYILVDESTKCTAIVDPAWEMDKIVSVLEGCQVKVDAILLTHSHMDHVHLVPQLTRKYRSKVYMSRSEAEFYDYQVENLYLFEDMETIWIGNTPIMAMVTPGHTVGSTCFLLTNDILTGDTLFVEGCGTCSSIGGNPESMFDSIQRLKSKVRPYVHILPGHSFGGESMQPFSRLMDTNIYLHFDTKAEFVKFRMRENQPLLYSFQ